MPQLANDLWSLALDRQEIDPDLLTAAIEDQVRRQDLDFRTRLLIRDSLDALQQRWGPERTQAWLWRSPQAAAIRAIWTADLGEPGFPSLRRRVVETTRPETIRTMFREVGHKIRARKPLRMYVGDSGA